jgi:hypothetical protein
MAAKQKVFVLKQLISSQTAVYNPFSVKLVSEVYLLQETSYLTFYTSQEFWQAL